jgi:hypothetical protein
LKYLPAKNSPEPSGFGAFYFPFWRNSYESMAICLIANAHSSGKGTIKVEKRK